MFHSPPPSPRHFARRWASLAVVGAAVAALLAAPSAASADVPTISIADTGADAHTRSLFRYLSEVSGTGVLFGQQHAVDESISPAATGPDGQPVSSDSYATTGHLPGLFGFDTLALLGGEKPGAAENTLSQNADLLGQAFVRADALGAVVTLSAHMPNFVTGGNFNDTSGGDVISHILPGGDRNADFTAYLDGVARAAAGAVRADGSLVPVVFRPFHENTGSWFWWGTANSSAETYKEAFRYTVEYLRDVKGVHNLLYAYSPNGSLDADPARYLATYPGDQWVDVMGYDFYQTDPSEAGTQTWLDQLVGDLGMISRLAQVHGKIPALTEFGRGGAATVTESGNTGLQYFTRLLQAIRADTDAARIAYMQTWANFSASTVYVPPPGHDLAPDFMAYESDARTLFAGEAMSRFDLPATAGAQEPTVRLMTPSSGSRVASSPATVRAKVSGIDPAEVASVRFWTGDQNSAAQDLVYDPEQGLWMGTWDIDPSALNNSTLAVHVVAATSAGDLAWDGQIVAGAAPVFGAGVVDDFDGYGDDAALRTAYAVNNTTPDAISLADRDGGGALRLSYDLGPGGYLGVGKSFDPRADWSAFAGLSLFLDSDGSGQKLVLQITTTDGVFEANPSLATDVAGSVTVPWAQWVPAAWDTAHAGAALTPQRLASITGFWIYVNDVDGASAHAGSIVLDDIRATGTGEPSVPNTASTSVDDFESYTDDEALRGTWGNRGKTSLLTVSSDARTGERAMEISYDADRDGSWIDVSRSLSGGWQDADGLRLAVRGDGSTATLAIQIGTSQGRYWIATVPLSDSAWQDVEVPWSSFAGSWPVGLSDPLAASDLAEVSELVLAVSNAPAGSVGQVNVDDIALMTQAAPTEPGTPAEPGAPVDPGSPADPGAPDDPGTHGDPGAPAGDGANASAGDGTGVDDPAGSSLARTGAPDTALLSVWGLALLLLGATGAWRVRMRRA